MPIDIVSHWRALINAITAASGKHTSRVFAEWAVAREEQLPQRMIALGELPPDDDDPYAGGVREPVRPKPAPRCDRVAEKLPD